MDEEDDLFRFDLELTDKEIHFIGQSLAQWGALEHELFIQTLLTFDIPDTEEIVLPREMNNLQFSGVLKLWKERVVEKAKAGASVVLEKQYRNICELKEFRDALVHGMWEWSPANINTITTIRIRRREIIKIPFTADELFDFYSRVASINFKIRYPGGLEDISAKKIQSGGYISRRFLSMITNNNISKDWLSNPLADKNEDKK
jgi:hypothetical protein